MSISFSGSELINIAIDIERRGIAFYDVMAKSTDNPIACDAFRYLGDVERQHVKIFQSMLAEADKYHPSETCPGEYAAYLEALVSSAVFTDEMLAIQLATQPDSDIKALQVAIAAEKDSILFYYEMRDIMPPRAQPAVNRIITEEKLHLRQLSEIKKKLDTL